MLSILGRGTKLCDGLSRREWLRVGGLSAFGLSLPRLLQAKPGSPARRTRSCILLWLSGGPPQHETWDPKPNAPEGIRGDLKPIASAVPGLWVGELMPRVARVADKCCVLRSVSTRDDNHYSSQYYMLTGQPHSPPNSQARLAGVAPNNWPGIAAVVKHLRQTRGRLPAGIILPEQTIGNDFVVFPGQNAGFLGRPADPWLINCDPADPAFRIRELSLSADVPPMRLTGRESLLRQVDQHLGSVVQSGAPSQYDVWQQQSFELLRSAGQARAFDLDQEPARVRDRYGRHNAGQCVLLARRLVEGGWRSSRSTGRAWRATCRPATRSGTRTQKQRTTQDGPDARLGSDLLSPAGGLERSRPAG